MASVDLYASSPLDNQAPGFLSSVLAEAETLYRPSGSSAVCGQAESCLTAEGAVCQFESGQGQGNKREIIRRRWDNRRIKDWTFYSCQREAELSGPTVLDSSCGQGLRLAQSEACKGPGIQKVLLSLPETYMETGIQKVPAKWRMKAGRDKEWWTSSRITKVPISRAKGPSTSLCGEHLSPFPKLASFLFLLQGPWRRMFAFLWPSCLSRRWPKVSHLVWSTVTITIIIIYY